jgi:hypothetical protein
LEWEISAGSPPNRRRAVAVALERRNTYVSKANEKAVLHEHGLLVLKIASSAI